MKCPLTTRGGERRLLERGAEVRAHVAECEECTAWMRSHRAVWNLLDVWEASAPSPEFDRRLRRRLESLPMPAWWQRAFALPLAAATMMVLTVFLVGPPNQPKPAAPVPRAVSPVELSQINQAFEDLQLLHQLDSPQGEE